jgi:hypothetical protein
MKKIYTFIAFCLLFSRQTIAQNFEFAPLGAKWYYNEWFDAPSPLGSLVPHIVTVEGKELYHGKMCSKLVGVGHNLLTQYEWTTVISVPDTLFVHSQQDSVFFYSQLSEQFELLYDFGAQPGESWTIGGLGSLSSPTNMDSLRVTVDSIGQIDIGGSARRIQYVSFPGIPFDWGFSIIEGIGNTGFLTPDWGLAEGGPVGLRCYEDIHSELHLVEAPCDEVVIYSGLDDYKQQTQAILSPNPVSDLLSISLGFH